MNALRITGLCIACIGIGVALVRQNWSAMCWATSTGLLWLRLMSN